MKKAFTGIWLLLFFFIAAISYADLNIDLTGSHTDVQSSQTIRMHNITSPDFPGSYWVDFQWDPVNWVMIPINAGDEPTTGKSWTITLAGAILNGSARMFLTADLTNRVLNAQITGLSGEIKDYSCHSWRIAQGTNSFQVGNYPTWSVYAGQVAYTTYYKCEFGDACDTGLQAGSPFPDWFDFNALFGLSCTVNQTDDILSWILE